MGRIKNTESLIHFGLSHKICRRIFLNIKNRQRCGLRRSLRMCQLGQIIMLQYLLYGGSRPQMGLAPPILESAIEVVFGLEKLAHFIDRLKLIQLFLIDSVARLV